MKLFKKIAVGLSTLSLASGLYALPAFAATSATNTDITGDSFADSEAFDNDNVTVASSNVDQDLLNIDVSLASTGLNTQSGNEDDNTLHASNAGALYETSNFMNVNEVTGTDGATASNSDISAGSDGDALAEDNDKVSVTNYNYDTDVFNLTAAVANTGLNSQDNNEDGNWLTSGTAGSIATTSNVVNHNKTVGGSGTTAMATNSNITGDSFADSEAYDNDHIYVTNTNKDTDFTNITAAVSNSGLNSQSGNEDGNTMTTGNTGATTTASNYVNVNHTEVGGNSAIASNTNITNGSDGDSLAESNTKLNVTNTNTNTQVTNVSAAVSNSGGNDQSNNEDGNSMKTGTAASTGTTTNVVNGNQVSW